MQGIGEFFKKIVNRQTKEVFIRQAISEVLLKFVGEKIPYEKVSISDGVVTLKGLGSGAKSVLFVKKKNILEEINKVQDLRTIVDIR